MADDFLTPAAVWARLRDDGPGELALLDVREARAFVASHPVLARHAPLSALEPDVLAFVPRRSTAIVLYDDGFGHGPAGAAVAVLSRLGYTDVSILEGGLAAWVAAGLPVIDGFGALVKAFGDLARRRYGTPLIASDALQARLQGGLPTTLVDARPLDEYRFLSLPGARQCPGAELALCALPADEAVWAVNCFSRTRGILATTTLRLLGHRNAVFVEDGVMGWGVRGAPVVQNAEPGDALGVAEPAQLRARARHLRERHGLRQVDPATVSAWREDGSRTLHVFDVRPVADPALAGGPVRHVPGGQLFMHFENLVGTRGARLVLIDDPHGLRAAITAFWLTQLGQCEVFTLDGPWQPPPAEAAPPEAPVAGELDVPALRALLAEGRATVVDVGPSLDFERGHVPGAFYLLPSSLEPLAPKVGEELTVVFTSPDGRVARRVARDARSRWPGARFGWLAGGMAAWRAAGGAVETAWTAAQALTPFDDDWGSVMRVFGPRRDGVWADYLRWERALADRVSRDPSVRFRFLA